jgi:hypothetical protein
VTEKNGKEIEREVEDERRKNGEKMIETFLSRPVLPIFFSYLFIYFYIQCVNRLIPKI